MCARHHPLIIQSTPPHTGTGAPSLTQDTHPTTHPTTLTTPSMATTTSAPEASLSADEVVDIVDEHNRVLRQATRAEMVRSSLGLLPLWVDGGWTGVRRTSYWNSPLHPRTHLYTHSGGTGCRTAPPTSSPRTPSACVHADVVCRLPIVGRSRDHPSPNQSNPLDTYHPTPHQTQPYATEASSTCRSGRRSRTTAPDTSRWSPAASSRCGRGLGGVWPSVSTQPYLYIPTDLLLSHTPHHNHNTIPTHAYIGGRDVRAQRVPGGGGGARHRGRPAHAPLQLLLRGWCLCVVFL